MSRWLDVNNVLIATLRHSVIHSNTSLNRCSQVLCDLLAMYTFCAKVICLIFLSIHFTFVEDEDQ